MKTDYERYLFRLISQDKDESLESFVERLQNQSKKCKFLDEESQIKDQIIEKCVSKELRKAAFENKLTLRQLILTGKTLEVAEKNCKGEFPKSSKVNTRMCTRCGNFDHLYFERSCPALSRQCKKCLKIGHCTSMCRSYKRRADDESGSRDFCSSSSRREFPSEAATKRPKSEGKNSNPEIVNISAATSSGNSKRADSSSKIHCSKDQSNLEANKDCTRNTHEGWHHEVSTNYCEIKEESILKFDLTKSPEEQQKSVETKINFEENRSAQQNNSLKKEASPW